MRAEITNRQKRPARKMISAMFSNRTLLTFVLRIERNDKIQLDINMNMAIAVNSSMIVFSIISFMFNEVRTIKHKPNSVAEVFRI